MVITCLSLPFAGTSMPGQRGSKVALTACLCDNAPSGNLLSTPTSSWVGMDLYKVLRSASLVWDSTLLLFANKLYDGRVELAFQVDEGLTTEVSFVIERAADGIHFEPLARLGLSDRTEGGWYRYVDAAPRQGHNFYRVWMRSEQGSVVSGVVRVAYFAALQQVTLAPNPTTGIVQIDIREGVTSPTQIVVWGGDGSQRAVQLVALGQWQQQIDLSAWPPGVYFVQVMYNNMQRSEVFRVVKK